MTNHRIYKLSDLAGKEESPLFGKRVAITYFEGDDEGNWLKIEGKISRLDDYGINEQLYEVIFSINEEDKVVLYLNDKDEGSVLITTPLPPLPTVVGSMIFIHSTTSEYIKNLSQPYVLRHNIYMGEESVVWTSLDEGSMISPKYIEDFTIIPIPENPRPAQKESW